MQDGIARYKGMSVFIQCTEQLAVGGKVGVTAYESRCGGRMRVLMLLGKKLAPGDPDDDAIPSVDSTTELVM